MSNCLLIIIIEFGLLIFTLLLTTSTPAGDDPSTVYESSSEYFLRCMRMMRPGIVNPYHNQYYDSVMNKYEIQHCHRSLLLTQFSYIANGTLPQGYVEALQIRYKNNQTLIDFLICGFDFKQCSNETKALQRKYLDELQMRYRQNQTLVDLHTCIVGFGHCPYQTKDLMRRYYNDGLDFTHCPDETKALLSGYYDELPQDWQGVRRRHYDKLYSDGQ